jgi:cobalt-zinc-cadmium resistance protein CzcA
MVQAFVSGRDLVGYVADAKADIAAHVALPRAIAWNGAASLKTSSAPRRG